MTIKNNINHIVFVLDKSGSMRHIADSLLKVFKNQIAFLAQRSKEMDQETRVSVYTFSENVECLIYDKDVLRLPDISKYYQTGGNTDLIQGTLKSIEDLEKTPQLYGDHAFLVFVLTDGAHNCGEHNERELANKIKSLPENWTLATLVPNQSGVFAAKQVGFPAQNIQVWETTSVGMESAGNAIQQATNSYFTARAAGVRSVKNLFQMNVQNIAPQAVKQNLVELSPASYSLFPVSQKKDIKGFVEQWGLPYVIGSSYYMLTKPEKVQFHKQVCLQDKMTGKVYSGTQCRTMLNLPDYEVMVEPSQHPNYNIFFQSKSVNRWLVPGTMLLVMK